MRALLKSLAFRLGARLFAAAGVSDLEQYVSVLERGRHADEVIAREESKRADLSRDLHRLEARNDTLIQAVRVADSLLAIGEADRAREQLRMGLIAASKRGDTRPSDEVTPAGIWVDDAIEDIERSAKRLERTAEDMVKRSRRRGGWL